MDKRKFSEQQLQEQIKKLPKIEDHQSKEMLFEKIQAHTPSRQHTNKRQLSFRWLIPSMAGLTAAVILFIVLQSGVFRDDQITEHYEENMEIMSGHDQNDSNYDARGDMESEAMESAEFDEFAQNTEGFVEEELGEFMLYYQDEHQFPTFTIAVADQQNMFAIPITLVSTSSTGDPNDYYNRIDTFVDEDQLGVQTFPFEDIAFEFTEGNQQLYMTVADDYQFPPGSSNAYMFQKMVNIMFEKYSFDHITLQTDSTDQVDLGPIGVKDQLELQPVDNLAYKIYQYEQSTQRLFVPIDMTNGNEITNIEVALEEMQQDQSDFNVYATIPEEADYRLVTSDEETLVIAFTSYEFFGYNEMTYEMIQAILATAKSFGYTEVDLTIPRLDGTFGQFDLDHPIPVPDGINPQILH